MARVYGRPVSADLSKGTYKKGSADTTFVTAPDYEVKVGARPVALKPEDYGLEEVKADV